MYTRIILVSQPHTWLACFHVFHPKIAILKKNNEQLICVVKFSFLDLKTAIYGIYLGFLCFCWRVVSYLQQVWGSGGAGVHGGPLWPTAYYFKLSHPAAMPTPYGPPTLGQDLHSVESPSMVNPQWNIWYWGSRWNLHTVCWSAVGCEWGTTSVYFGITYVCFIPSRLPVFAVEPSTYLNIFYFCQKYHLNYTYRILKKFHVGLKFEWGL